MASPPASSLPETPPLTPTESPPTNTSTPPVPRDASPPAPNLPMTPSASPTTPSPNVMQAPPVGNPMSVAPPSERLNEGGRPIPFIIGMSVGGTVVFLVLVLLFTCWKWNKKRRGKMEYYGGSSVPPLPQKGVIF